MSLWQYVNFNNKVKLINNRLYSEVPLNRHLSKTATFLRRTTVHTLFPYNHTLYKTDNGQFSDE